MCEAWLSKIREDSVVYAHMWWFKVDDTEYYGPFDGQYTENFEGYTKSIFASHATVEEAFARVGAVAKFSYDVGDNTSASVKLVKVRKESSTKDEAEKKYSRLEPEESENTPPVDTA